jgi:hypothetical protein
VTILKYVERRVVGVTYVLVDVWIKFVDTGSIKLMSGHKDLRQKDHSECLCSVIISSSSDID